VLAIAPKEGQLCPTKRKLESLQQLGVLKPEDVRQIQASSILPIGLKHPQCVCTTYGGQTFRLWLRWLGIDCNNDCSCLETPVIEVLLGGKAPRLHCLIVKEVKLCITMLSYKGKADREAVLDLVAWIGFKVTEN